MTAGLFFLLPRTARAAFRSMVSERYHLPGFSSEITLGQIGELKQRSTPVMHVRIEAPNERLGLKWRGSALGQFNGIRWYNPVTLPERIRIIDGPTPVATDNQRRRRGPRISYQVRIGPIDSDTLFFAGIPEFVQLEDASMLLRGPGETYRSPGSSEGREYRAVAHRPEAGPDADGEVDGLPEQTFNEYLLLPGSTDRRILELARETAVGNSPLERARSLEKHLRTRFAYSTELPQQREKDPLADFLFVRKKGHCEYFASSMAVMLRVVHIPSRVVTGFQSGVYNPMTGWHVIRASDAHSWVEAWLPGRGWTTFDPTPPDTSGSHGMGAIWSQVMLYLDAAETLWRQWIVDYNLEQQLGLIARVERRTRMLNGAVHFDRFSASGQWVAGALSRWGKYLALAVTAAVMLAFLGPPMWRLLVRRRHAARISRGQVLASDAAVLYGRMLDALRRRGVEKPGWLTPGEFARSVPPSPVSRIVEQITAEYHDLRYAGRPEAAARMLLLLQELETTKS
jgi:transglutaminase-like putative cysteine protease